MSSKCALDVRLLFKHGCGKMLVVDGNKKNHDVCLAGNARYAEYIPGRVRYKLDALIHQFTRHSSAYISQILTP